MKRIMIIGCSGSGKSTLARQLGDILQIPVVHLDRLWWKPGWETVSREEFDKRHMAALSEPHWIIDGDFSRTIPERMAACDTVIYLDFHRVACLLGVLKRVFTNLGKVHMQKAYQIPEASRTAKGTNIVNIIDMQQGEKITSMISIEEFSENEYLTMVTKQGVIKRTLLSEYEYHRKGGKIALNLDEGDELVFVMHTHGECDLILATANGYAVRFTEANVRPMGRTARGVKGITLRGDDYVTGVALVGEGKKLITITENGYGKRTEFSDFREMKNRGGVGVQCHSISDKTGRLCGIASVCDDDDLMMITDAGTIIRTPVSDVPTYSRTAGGVIMMRLADGQKLVNFTTAKKADEEELDEVIETVETTEATEPVEITDETTEATEE